LVFILGGGEDEVSFQKLYGQNLVFEVLVLMNLITEEKCQTNRATCKQERGMTSSTSPPGQIISES